MSRINRFQGNVLPTQGGQKYRTLTSSTYIIWGLTGKCYQTLPVFFFLTIPVLRRCCFPKIHTSSSVSGNSSRQSVKIVIWFSYLDKTERKRKSRQNLTEGACLCGLLIITFVLKVKCHGLQSNGSKLFSIFQRILLFIFRDGEGKEKERERNINVWLPLLRTWPATQVCALAGNRTGNLLVRRPVLNPLSYTSQGQSKSFSLRNKDTHMAAESFRRVISS